MESGGGDGGGREPGIPPTAEEEALKRNTDCVYFLASPLTCKKGSECEYRHSEGARVNPRDCWFWLNGNCLNPKCSFRHPPLDGLFGIPGTTSVPVPPPSQVAASGQIHAAHGPAAYSSTKPNVPCYFFQKGQCLKGDKCPFMHVVQPAGNPVAQQVAKLSTFPSDPPTLNKDSFILKECTSQQSIPKANINKPVEVQPSSAKPFTMAESVPNNGSAVMQNAPPYLVEDELQRFQPSDIPVSSGNAVSRPRSRQSQSVDERLQNGREGDEFLGESSPGFDVLVDDNVDDSDYFRNEEDFGRAAGQGGRNLNAANEFDYHHSDYEPVSSFDREPFNGIGEYDRYARLHSQYGREQGRTSLERVLERPSMPERRVTKRESLGEIDGSDLRHRLLKQRKVNGSRPAVSPDRRGDWYRRDNDYAEEERRRGSHPRRDQQRVPMESSISSRLQGRIKLPVRSSPDRPVNLWSERERDRDRGRHRGRSSPGRPINNQGRHHDRIKRRSHENVSSDERNFESHPIRRNETGPLDFASPKSLAQLKGTKVYDNSPRQKSTILGKDVGHQDSEGTLSFEGPKPLSVILKRKRGAAAESGPIPGSEDGNNERGAEGVTGKSASAAVSDTQTVHLSEAEKEGKHPISCFSEHKIASTDEEEEEGQIPRDEGQCYDDQSSAKGNGREAEVAIMVDAMDYQELENYDQRDGEYAYEAAEGGDFKTEDDEKPYQEDEEEDDEDDFAKKVGVMFS